MQPPTLNYALPWQCLYSLLSSRFLIERTRLKGTHRPLRIGHSYSIVGTVVIALVYLLGAFCAFTTMPVARGGTSETQYSEVSHTLCISSYSSSAYTSLFDWGSAGTWVLEFTFGLHGGDDNQYVKVYAEMVDYNANKVIATWGVSEQYWADHQHSNFTQGTMTAPTGGPLTVIWDVDNNDAVSQCFWLNVYPSSF